MATSYRYFGFDYPPFANTVDPQFLFPSAGVRHAWSCLVKHLQSGRDVILLLGKPGSGKTLLYRYLLEKQWSHIPIAMIANPHLQPVELLASVCDDFGISYPLEQPEEHLLLKQLSEFLASEEMRSGRVMLIVDEAQDLTAETLDTLRRINWLGKAADNILTILLVGQHEMVETIKGTLIPESSGDPALAACILQPLSKGETIAYIRYRLKIAGGNPNLFTRGAALTAYRVASGIPRVINILCDHALHEAQARSKKKITSRLIRLCIRKFLNEKQTDSLWSRLVAIPSELIGMVLDAIRQRFPGHKNSVQSLPPASSLPDERHHGSGLQPREPGHKELSSDQPDLTAIVSTGKEYTPPPSSQPSAQSVVQKSTVGTVQRIQPPAQAESPAVGDWVAPPMTVTESPPSKAASGTKRSEADSGKLRRVPSPPPEMVFIDSMQLRSAYSGRAFPIRAFFLDLTPVTYAAYSRFIAATNHPPPHDWYGTKPPPRLHDRPVVNVSLEDARRFAQWCGKRLPTFLEWECAARHPDQRRFPWGNEWDADRCNNPESGPGELTAVDAYPEGSSADGCLDLVGNAWEWTELPEQDQAEGDLPEPGYLWVMGGSFLHACRVDGTIARTAVIATQRYRFLGFRCVREVV